MKQQDGGAALAPGRDDGQPAARPQDGARGRNLSGLIIATFLELVRTRHPATITFRDIAAAAGISHMAPYRHFKSKQEMLNRIADIGFGMLAQQLDEVVARHPKDPRRQIFEACACYYRFAAGHPAHAQVMFGTSRELWDRAEPLPSMERTRAILLRIIHACQLSGDVPRGIDEKKLLGLLWAHVHGFTLLAANRVLTENETGAPEAFIAAGVRVILGGLGELDPS